MTRIIKQRNRRGIFYKVVQKVEDPLIAYRPIQG